jgi:hypothetical protein
MRCPRCTLAELPEGTDTCWLCGQSGGVALAEEAPPPPPTATELDARRELAHAFRIESLLERPPGPIVYLARDREDRQVALKVLPRDEAGATPDRFNAAAAAAAQLDHPHIVPVYGHGATENFLWCASRYVDGRSLGHILLTTGSLELSACLRIFEQVASALDYAHRRGVSHGALTLDCIIVDANEWALVGDFAMRGLLDATPGDARAGDPAAGADQRALAAIAHQCLTGAPPGEGPPTVEDGNAGVPMHVSQAVRRAFSSQPAERFPSVLDFVAALGGTRPDARTAWFGANPHQKKGPRAPVVIVDADTEPATRRIGGRLVAAAAGLLVVLGGGAAWLGISSSPAAPVHREPAARAAAPAPPPMASPSPAAPSASDDSFEAVDEPRSPPPSSTAPARTPRPPVTTRPAVVKRPAPPPPQVDERNLEPGLLSVNAIPWGSVYLDGRPLGNTPQIDLSVPAGPHRLRVEREGFRPYDRVIEVASGQRLRITDIALVER